MQNPLIKVRKVKKEVIVEAESLTNIINARSGKSIWELAKHSCWLVS